MLANLFEVRQTKKKGKGLFAKEFIPKGTIVCFECDKCRVFSASEIGYDKMSDKEKMKLLDYAYRKEDGTFVVPCGDIRYLNHSCNSNILTSDLGFDIVVMDIKKSEEATYDYRNFYEDVKMPCYCAEKDCCKIVEFTHPVPEELDKLWRKKISSALKYVNRVYQPLKEELQQISIFLPLKNRMKSE